MDANVLLYAVNTSAQRHDESRQWVDRALAGRETIGFPWVVLLAFLRVSTRRGVFPRPLDVAEATAIVDEWLAAAPSMIVSPSPRHAALLADLLLGLGTGGNIVNDAHLAVLALEHGATVVTWDSDFGRFPGVSWMSPP